jgi:hypothetical protein
LHAISAERVSRCDPGVTPRDPLIPM